MTTVSRDGARPRALLDAVGATPLLRLGRVTTGLAAAVYVKLESLNPGGSVKDRAALSMVRDAEARGDLPATGGVIVEGSSGNTGVGLAMVAVQHEVPIGQLVQLYRRQ